MFNYNTLLRGVYTLIYKKKAHSYFLNVNEHRLVAN